MMKPSWTSGFAACTTQLENDQLLDLPATVRRLEVLIQSGLSGVVMCGSLA